ncbi:Domain of unknown function (DUF3437), putative [Hepatocystis sp. ex Piliocolobus tephrosceles]|nr:Domain of unknown function (DUF3437), putative [Hepatocystis sp. ex Piliocolobus tephrosceles]
MVTYESFQVGGEQSEKSEKSEEGKSKNKLSEHNTNCTSFDILLKTNIRKLIQTNLISLLSHSNWKVRINALHFCYNFHYYYCIYFYAGIENQFFLNIFISLLVDKYIEIHNSARNILSSVFCYYDSQVLQTISNFFLILVNEKKSVTKGETTKEINTSSDVNAKIIERKKNIAIFTLISIINSFPNYIPNWLPNVLINVAKMTNNTVHSIKKEIEECLQNFLRTHKDEWEFKYKLAFTEEQLNIMDMYKGGLNYFT